MVTSSLQDHAAFIERYKFYLSTVTRPMATKFEKQVHPQDRKVDTLESNKVGISDVIPLKSREFEKMSNSFSARAMVTKFGQDDLEETQIKFRQT